MKLLAWMILFLSAGSAGAQPDTGRVLRAFPITDYMLDLNDSVKLVQVELPDDLQIKDKQIGLLRGTYQEGLADTAQKGYGRCQLIKGNFYYFTISGNSSGSAPKKGDLLYTFMENNGQYPGMIPALAAHYIRLLNVFDEPVYDRFDVFRYWSQQEEDRVLDSLVNDIRFTGQYFLENDPSQNGVIGSGSFAGKKILELMKECRTGWLKDFFSYILARPRLYAGREWKCAEIFATWLKAGAPVPERR